MHEVGHRVLNKTIKLSYYELLKKTFEKIYNLQKHKYSNTLPTREHLNPQGSTLYNIFQQIFSTSILAENYQG